MNKKDIPKKIAVKKSSAGLGLFAIEDFKKGEPIIEYTGDRITDVEAQKREGKYLFEVHENLTIDGTKRHNTARYMNHACKPNAEAEHDEATNRIYIRAKKSIKLGEEVTYHYGKDYFKRMIQPIGCKCISCFKKA